MSFDLSKFIDKLEPQLDDNNSMVGKVYFNNVNETIKEEDDEDLQGGLLSSYVYNKLKASHDKVNSFKFLQLG